ncbi:MAG TPA: LTA synthase family protein, partial [Nocardioidaceae bacterium]|nr:LTA synthase family protein [Nocardioidaceae bacterium]
MPCEPCGYQERRTARPPEEQTALDTDHRPHPTRRALSAAGITLAGAVAVNLVLELSQLDRASTFNGSAFATSPGLFALNTAVIWLVVGLIASVLGRVWPALGLAGVVTVVLAYANHEKLQLRLEPLYPNDLALALQVKFLGQMVGPGAAVALTLAAVLVLGLCLGLGRLARRRSAPPPAGVAARRGRGLVLGRVALALACAAALTQVVGFNTPGNPVRNSYESLGASWKWWHQKANYAVNGFVGGFLYNLSVPAMTRPRDYSAATMHRIAEKYAGVADAINRHRDPSALDDVNVVAVLSEAFSDPTRIEGPEFARDPLPRTRRLMAATTSGNMLAQRFGGGTANMEFEVLTGQSLALFQPQLNTPFQQLVPEYDTFPSVVGYLEERGYRSVAVHPYMTSMYKRREVYPTLGIDEFVHDETMREARTIDDNDFISDASAFDEVLRRLEESRDPTFVNLVTMQNHFPMAGKYDDPIPVTGIRDPGERAEAAGYARGLRHSDAALADFLERLESGDEKTVVVFYGDHQPAFWSPETRAKNPRRVLRETPFFVWSSFDAPRPRALPT